MAPQGIRVKILQLNIWGGRLEKQITDLIIAEQPDILCLQEVISSDGDAATVISLEEICKKTDYSHQFMSPVFSYNLMNKIAHYGNAIVSREPITVEETIFTNMNYTTDFDFDTHDYNIRNLQHAVITVGGKQLNVLNHHGHHVREHKRGNDDTLRQMTQIKDYISTLDGPVILTGDFNLAPDSESLEILNAQLTNLPLTHHLSTTRNHLTPKNEVCDYIFVNDQVQVSSFIASDTVASDHMALIMEFDLV